MNNVTDPALLAQLNAPAAAPPQEPTAAPIDESTLERLNAPVKEEESWYEDFGEGLGVSGLSTYYGIKDLIVGMDDEDMATLKDWKDDAAESGWGTFGEVVGEIAQIAMPAGVLTKGMKVAGKVKNLGRTAPLIADAVATGAVQAAKVPSKGDSRLDSAIEGVTDTLTGGAITRGLSKAMRGVDVTKYAKDILDKGGFLTAGKAAKSKGIAGMEAVAEVTPFLAKGLKKAQEKARKSWEKIALNEAAPIGAKVSGTGQDAVKTLKASYDTAYDSAWGKAKKVTNEGVTAFNAAAQNAAKFLPANEVKKIGAVAGDLRKVLTEPSAKAFKAFDNRIRRTIGSVPYDNRELRDGLKGMRSAFRSGLPEDTIKELAAVDKQYAKYLVVKKATSAAAEEAGEFTPKQLLKASKAVGGETSTAMGESALQDIATAGVKTVDQKLGGQPLDFFRRIAGAVPSPLPIQAASNALIGQNPLQKLAKKGVNSETIKQLRKYLPTGGQLGGAILNDREDY